MPSQAKRAAHDADNGPGYTERDIEELAQDRRFLAAVHEYARDGITMGEAIVLAARDWPLIPERFKLRPIAYDRLIHEVAGRILAGSLPVPDDIRDEYARISQHPLADWKLFFAAGAPAHRFSELESTPADKNPLTVRRQHYNEQDLQELIESIRFLACVDAYRHNLITFRELRRRLFEDESFIPRGLSDQAFLDLVFEVVRRIERQQIRLPTALRETCSFAYLPGPANEDD